MRSNQQREPALLVQAMIKPHYLAAYKPSMKVKGLAGHGASLLLVLVLSTGFLLASPQLDGFGIAGYPLVFGVSLVGSATLFLPAPSLVLILTFGGMLNPVGLGLAAGSGAAIGELTGYLVGYSGTRAVEQFTRFRSVERWMGKADLLIIFLLALIPVPFADIGGIAAGTSKMSIWRFLIATWAGKSLRYTALAFLGAKM